MQTLSLGVLVPLVLSWEFLKSVKSPWELATSTTISQKEVRTMKTLGQTEASTSSITQQENNDKEKRWTNPLQAHRPPYPP